MQKKINYEWFQEQKDECFDKMASLQCMLEDNYDLFENVIDTETLHDNPIQMECLSYLMPEEVLIDLIEFLLLVSRNAQQSHKNKFGTFAYLEFNGRIFYISDMQQKKGGNIYQFVLVDEMPEEDENIVPFDIVWYGLDSFGDLFFSDRKKLLKNLCYKYNIKIVENPKDDLENHYFVTDNQITYRFSNTYDPLDIKKVALIYFYLGRKKVELPVYTDLEFRLRAWDNALSLMARDGIKIIGNSETRRFIRNKTLKNFINEDILTYFQGMKGLFESEPEKKINIIWHNGNAHVERVDVQ